MDTIINFLKEFNIQTIISLSLIMWYFTRDIKNSIDNLDRDIRDMNTRVSRLEGTVYGKDMYNIKDEK